MTTFRTRRQQLEGDVVRDGIALEPRNKSFSERGLRLDNELLSIDPHENVRTELSFSGEEQGRDCFARDEATKIIAKLAGEIAKAVGTGDTHARALKRFTIDVQRREIPSSFLFPEHPRHSHRT